MSTTSVDLRRSGVTPSAAPAKPAAWRIPRFGRAGAEGDGEGRKGGDLTRSRLLKFGAIIAAAIIASVAISVYSSSTFNGHIEGLHDEALGLLAVEQTISDGEAIRGQLLLVVVAREAGSTDEVVEGVELAVREAHDSLDGHIEEVAAAFGDHPEMADKIAGLQALAAELEAASEVRLGLDKALRDLTPEEMLAASTMFEDFTVTYDELRVVQEELSDLGEEALNDEDSTAKAASARNEKLILASAVVALAVFVWVGRKVLAAVMQMRTMQVEMAEITERERAQAADVQAKVDSMLAVLAAAAAGDLTHEVTVSGDDAIGQMGEALSKLLGDFRVSVTAIAANSEALAAAAEELQVVSEQMGANAAQTSSQVNLVSGASVEVSASVETVSNGAEEMSASIKEIAKNASEAATVAGHAVEAAAATNETVSKLGDSSAEIGEILKVITGIAQQTNLLALNATIEAARAGEAGKGFAVVANEVKELAKETAKATEDIGLKIEAIQTDTKRSVDAIGEISGIIDQIAEFQETIASAVEQQAATTSEIAHSVTDASRGSTEITANMQAVADAADSTATGASDSQRAATELSRMASDLQNLVGRFTY